MTHEKIGAVTIVRGENNSKFPYSTSLLIEGNQSSTLIDCGVGKNVVQNIKDHYHVSRIYLTHYHKDHVSNIPLFPEAQILINTLDINKMNDPYELYKANGTYACRGKKDGERLVQEDFFHEENSVNSKWRALMGKMDATYAYDTEIDVEGTRMMMLHSPGHTDSNCFPYFPEHGVLLVGDIDLSSFGPWYNSSDSDRDAFITSAERTLETDAEYFVTSHHKGVFRRKEYKERLEAFLDIIKRRDEVTKDKIEQGVSPEELIHQSIFFLSKSLEKYPDLMDEEKLGIAKHIVYLIQQGYPYQDYLDTFLEVHQLHKEYLQYNPKTSSQ